LRRAAAAESDERVAGPRTHASEDAMTMMRFKDIAGLLGRPGLAVAVAAALICLSLRAEAAAARPAAFVSPEEAVAALIEAARAGSAASMLKILGADGKALVLSGDPVADDGGRKRFVAAYDKEHSIDRESPVKAVLIFGEGHVPFVIPLLRQGTLWHFDTKTGAREILARRIGRNELSAIEVCRAYVDAQRDYASKDRQGDGLLEYAQHLVSSPGKHDGLYWPAQPGEEESPFGPLAARARAEGYGGKGKGTPYQGYYYKILTRQGAAAPGGAHDYVAHGRMIGGFALVAFPARYRASGVMTFVVNQDGVVYEKNLGPDSAQRARAMTSFNPDSSWKKL
jgi:hypothetical protein